jgi:uncharacterized protein YraI
METKHGFTKMTLSEFETWIKNLRVSRTVLKIQQHHTSIPSYEHFTGTNHFERQKAMRDYHVNSNGWADIGQHFTIFPDGTILTGRNMEHSSACIYGQNANAICIENLGDFDKNKNTMTKEQKESIVQVTALLCKKFNIPVSTNFILYHHWFDLSSGVRNNGTGNNKSCPGTNFFGGNKVEDCQKNFIPLVANALSGVVKTEEFDIEKYVCVTASSLNVRVLPSSSAPKASDRTSVPLGSVLRVYGEQDGWLKISKSDSRWVSSRYTTKVERALVTADILNVRTGPTVSFPKVEHLSKGEIVFVTEIQNGWCKIGLEEKWVSKDYLKF